MGNGEFEWDFFIAYSRADSDAAEELYTLLALTHATFLDSRCLRPGDDWDRALFAAQRRSRITVVLLSDHTDEAYYQRDEIAAAITMARESPKRHHVVPVDLDDSSSPAGRSHYGLHLKHRLSVTEQGGLQGVAERLKELRTSLGSCDSHPGAVAQKPEIALDLSHQQGDWRYLEEIADDPALPLRVIRRQGNEWREALQESSVLILPLPRRQVFTGQIIDEVERWVRRGGGLFLMGYYAAATHHESNPNHLARRFGIEFNDDLIMPPGRSAGDTRRHVFSIDPDLAVKVHIPNVAPHPVLDGVREVAFLSACSLDLTAAPDVWFALRCPSDSEVMRPEGEKSPEGWRLIIVQWRLSDVASVPLLAIREHGNGRVVISGTWKLCTLQYADNTRLVRNILTWLSPRKR